MPLSRVTTNKSADQPEDLHSLISAIIIRFTEKKGKGKLNMQNTTLNS